VSGLGLWRQARQQCLLAILSRSVDDGADNVSGFVPGTELQLVVDFETRDWFERNLYDTGRGEWSETHAYQSLVMLEYTVEHLEKALWSPVTHAVQLAATAPLWPDVPWSGLREARGELCEYLRAQLESGYVSEWEVKAVDALLAGVGSARMSLDAVRRVMGMVPTDPAEHAAPGDPEWLLELLQHAETHLAGMSA